MARWRLRTSHYLKVPDTVYIYEEVDRTTGKLGRKIFNVPLLLDPANPADCNYPGEIIVCHAGKGADKDYVFDGQPTPDMDPIDEEARAITTRMEPSWRHPIDSLPGTFSASLIEGFQKDIDALRTGQMETQAVKASEFDILKGQVAELMKQNKELAEKAARRL